MYALEYLHNRWLYKRSGNYGQIYPSLNKNFHGNDVEHLVYDSLQQGLSNNYTMFHPFA